MQFQQFICIIGYGSIGARHYRNLLALGYANVFVHDADVARMADIPLERRVIALTPRALSSFAVVLICSPTNLHLRHVYSPLVREFTFLSKNHYRIRCAGFLH